MKVLSKIIVSLLIIISITACTRLDQSDPENELQDLTSTVHPKYTKTPTPTSTVTSTPTTTANPEPPLLQVNENYFVDEDGNIVILRGVAIMNPILLASGQNSNLGPWREEIFETLHEWGANVVRLPINPPMFLNYGVKDSLSVIDKAIAWAGKYGMYVILDFHGLGFPPDRYNKFDWAATTEQGMIDFWRLVSRRYAGNNIVAFYEIYNEPGRERNGPAKLDDWLIWKDLCERVIGYIRENDNETIIIVGGMGYGNDLSYVLEAPIDGENIAYTTHPYPGTSRWVPWQKAFGDVPDHYPVILTEFGFDNELRTDDFLHESNFVGPGLYRDKLMEYVDERGISWTSWVFSHSWTPRMLLDDNYTPSEFGQFIKDQLKKNTAEYGN